ncbi:LysR family transcriptional regulator [Rhizobiales bacterium RZME27]|uniref:LysR family transcriptional regulator n=1 Tax=Endobacterium cereale TaxID=2663029 RepID=A0A6A8A9T4_9HYPH|nr:LysR family transcriptional regulator [Endobacterium cereale]MEB2847104.1 LysR family transcriptional regulator [Endobacterium cereale]MQY47479.1 LysR family transcriptional regulator [Endobacterium cereale]
MPERPSLSDLDAFMAIVSHRSFRKAADELGLSPSTLSHMMRGLETTLGVRLLNRTTRSVAPTEAGERLASQLRPALSSLDRALAVIDDFRSRPSGVLRINGGEPAIRYLVQTVVPEFLERFPEIALDLVTDGRFTDIVAEGFDAGVRLGYAVPQDMIGVPFGGRARFVTVASPAYLEKRGTPQTPDDLKNHSCIRLRMPSGKLFRWEFERHGQEVVIDVPGALTLDHLETMAEAATRNLGIAYLPQLVAAPYLERGALLPALEDWCPWMDGLMLYYAGHRHVPPPLRAFIDTLKEVDRRAAVDR